MTNRSVDCPVCEGTSVRDFGTVGDRAYWRCDECQATFLDPAQRPTRDEELARYRQHRNDPEDAAYRRFLDRMAAPLLERLPARQRGLDYGCGPGPALAAMLREAGHEVALYDPFFAPDRSVITRTYDFVTCTETAEHFHRPADEFRRIDALLVPGGWLAVMTAFLTDDAKFAGWYYRRDPTHVVFYREATLRCVAERQGWRCEFPVPDVALMEKPAGIPGV